MAWRGFKKTVTIIAAANNVIDTIRIQEGASRLNFEIANSDNVLDQFAIQFQMASDTTWTTVASTTNHYSSDALRNPVVFASTDMSALAAASVGAVIVDVKGIYRTRFLASCPASSETSVDLRWQVR